MPKIFGSNDIDYPFHSSTLRSFRPSGEIRLNSCCPVIRFLVASLLEMTRFYTKYSIIDDVKKNSRGKACLIDLFSFHKISMTSYFFLQPYFPYVVQKCSRCAAPDRLIFFCTVFNDVKKNSRGKAREYRSARPTFS